MTWQASAGDFLLVNCLHLPGRSFMSNCEYLIEARELLERVHNCHSIALPGFGLVTSNLLEYCLHVAELYLCMQTARPMVENTDRWYSPWFIIEFVCPVGMMFTMENRSAS